MAERGPDQPCKHLNFAVDAEVSRDGEGDPGSGGMPMGYMLSVKVSCECGEPFRFNGVQPGMSYQHPMGSVDGATLMAPMRPASAGPDFGKGLPGFTVKRTFP